METVQIATRVEKAQSAKFQKIARKLGISPADALRMFIAEFNRQNGFWYSPKAEPFAEPFETEEEALEFATDLSMRQINEG